LPTFGVHDGGASAVHRSTLCERKRSGAGCATNREGQCCVREPLEQVFEGAKALYRRVRARLLSLDLAPSAPFVLGNEEREASARMSVIVAVHDAPEDTLRCLRSLERFGGRAEIIIVDDGSRLAVTKRLLEGVCLSRGWPLITNGKAMGHSRASESGVSISTRPYVCLLNSDAIVTSRSWLGIARAFAESPEVAVVGPSTSYTPTPQCLWRAQHCRHYWSDEQIWCFAEKNAARHQFEPFMDLPMVGGFAFFVRRAVWDQLGGFDTNLPDYGNETEFCQRVTRAGQRIVWAKGSYIHHLGSASYGRTLGFREIQRRCLEARDYIQEKGAP